MLRSKSLSILVGLALLLACDRDSSNGPSGEGGSGGGGGEAGEGGTGGIGGIGGTGGNGGEGGTGGSGGEPGSDLAILELDFEGFCAFDHPCSYVRRGDTRQMFARGIDVDGEPVERVEVTWSSSNEEIVTVDQTGFVRAVGVGHAHVRGTVGSLTASMRFTVSPERVFRVEVEPERVEVPLGGRVRLEAVGINEADEAIPDAYIEFASMNPSVAIVEFPGVVRAVGPGSAWIAASSPDGIPGHVRYSLVEVQTNQVLPPGAPFVQIAGDGSVHRCGLLADGTAHCWGRNDEGQLGRGYFTPPEYAHLVPGSVAGDHRFQSISSNCGLDLDGQLWCWGNNTAGDLGLGQEVDGSPEPLPVVGGHVFESFAGSCAIDSAAQAWCWGPNGEGQVGTGVAYQDDPQDENWIIWEPAPVVGGHRFVELATTITRWANCARDEDGEIWCWGSNTFGALGIGESEKNYSATPVRIAAEGPFVRLVGGTNAFCALTAAGEAWCWGNNYAGSLDPSQPERNEIRTPTRILPDFEFRDLAMGFFSACGLDAEGKAWCWGINEYGQTGTGLFSEMGHEPRPVYGDHRFQALFPHCGITVDGEALCWGFNDFGVTGGNFLGDLTPVPWPVAHPDDDAEPVVWLP